LFRFYEEHYAEKMVIAQADVEGVQAEQRIRGTIIIIIIIIGIIIT